MVESWYLAITCHLRAEYIYICIYIYMYIYIYIGSALHAWHINSLLRIAVRFVIFLLKIIHFTSKNYFIIFFTQKVIFPATMPDSYCYQNKTQINYSHECNFILRSKKFPSLIRTFCKELFDPTTPNTISIRYLKWRWCHSHLTNS